VSGLATAARLAAAEPGSRWLFVTVETCSISIRLDSDDPAAIVATALFGDGAAAAVVCAGGETGIGAIEAAGEHLWPSTLGIMGWRVEDPGLAVIFDRSIPVFLEAHLGPALQSMLAQMGLDFAAIDRLCSHPGGVKVLDAIESSLSVAPLDFEREVLDAHGNMSAPTVLFVLDRLIARGLPPRTLLTALGPGFTLSALSLVAGR
jgi:alkylresorcinol/alkylpyrone synthase